MYPGNATWTGEGHRFAWRMKLRDMGSKASFQARDPATGRTWQIDPLDYVSAAQHYRLTGEPELLHQFCRKVAALLAREGRSGIEIRVDAWGALNGRRPQRLVDPTVNLAGEPRRWPPAGWILPLEPPGPSAGR